MENVKDLLSKKLVTLSQGITIAERAEAEKEIPVSKPTLDKYLAGDIVKIDTALKLIEFFAKKVRARLEFIKETSAV